MRTQTLVVILLIQTVGFHAKSQSQGNVNKLVGSYVLKVEVLHKPAGTIEWLGSFKKFSVKPLKDYKGNFGVLRDSISILIDLRDTVDISVWSQLKAGDQRIVFVTSTSLFGIQSYYVTVSDPATGNRIGDNDLEGFRIGSREVTYREFKRAIDSVNLRAKIEKKCNAVLARYALSDGRTSGIERLWAGKRSNSVYADGVYVAHWATASKAKRHLYIYSGERTRVLANGSDVKIVAQVRRFILKQGGSDQEFQECLEKVRFHLDHRTQNRG